MSKVLQVSNDITKEEIQSLIDCKSEIEWNKACDNIKAARGGNYPNDWYVEVVISGVATTILATIGGTPDIKIV